LIYGRDDNSEIRQAINDIRELKVDVSYPFLLEVFDDYSKGLLSDNDLLYILRLVESYVFRRAICLIPTNSLNKTFATLAREIDKDNYIESLKVAFRLKEGYMRFPTDEEFKAQFPTVPLYNLRIKYYALQKLENFHHRKEHVDIKNCTIEHILPQNKNLPSTWRDALGDNWEEIQQKYLHTIGNLTITAYNSELGDLSFLEKRDKIGCGFHSSPLSLNHDLAELDRWNKNEIEKRAAELTALAINIWPAPSLPNSILEKYMHSTQNEQDHVYSEEDHLRKGDDNTKRLYYSLKDKVRQIGNGITIRPVRYYIGFVKNRNFIAVKIRRAYLLVDLVTQDHFQDPKGISIQAQKTHYGGRIRRVRVGNESIFNELIPLIKQTYETA
jgi:predicted transport protein